MSSHGSEIYYLESPHTPTIRPHMQRFWGLSCRIWSRGAMLCLVQFVQKEVMRVPRFSLSEHFHGSSYTFTFRKKRVSLTSASVKIWKFSFLKAPSKVSFTLTDLWAQLWIYHQILDRLLCIGKGTQDLLLKSGWKYRDTELSQPSYQNKRHILTKTSKQPKRNQNQMATKMPHYYQLTNCNDYIIFTFAHST